jgi:hypothetical protein
LIKTLRLIAVNTFWSCDACRVFTVIVGEDHCEHVNRRFSARRDTVVSGFGPRVSGGRGGWP